MKIINIEPFIISYKLKKCFSFSQWEYCARKHCIVKITTNEGVTGWGEGYGPAEVIKAGIDFFRPFITGQAVLNTEEIWQLMYTRSLDYARRGVLLAALSAIDIALWDIKGKILNQPVSVLLGGRKRDYIQAYASGMYFTDVDNLPSHLSEEALKYKEEGFELMKMKVGLSIKEDIQNISTIREAIGDDIKLMVDANHAYSLNEAISLANQMKEYDIEWFEEPLGPDQYDNFTYLRSKIEIPIAAGECEYLRAGFHQLFRNQCVDIAQPDICAAGGFTEVKKIVSLAQTYGVSVVPHTWGTGIALATSLQLLSNFDILPGRLKKPNVLMEFDCTENGLRDALVYPTIKPVEGKVQVPSGPGLGIEVNEEMIKKYSINKN
jgi:D-galactarolactone cycloisomerase